MFLFLANNRGDLIARCKAKAAQRPFRAATQEQLKNGIPLFLEQLGQTLEADERGQPTDSLRISGATGIEPPGGSEMSVTAAGHGKQLLELGYTVDQVVHDYGDLCQAITDLAAERDAPFSIDEFRTLNRCLDNAIAAAVTEFSAQRDVVLERVQSGILNERLGVLAHELRNGLGTATLAVKALETGNLPMSGATGSILKRSLASLAVLVGHALDEVRTKAEAAAGAVPFALDAFVAEAARAAVLDARARGCTLDVGFVDPELSLVGNRADLLAALANLLQNAFKFTEPGTGVRLTAEAVGTQVLVKVEDHCGGLAPGAADRMFAPFSKRSGDRTGLGLGLTIARSHVEADCSTLNVENRPGSGCVFTMAFSRSGTQAGTQAAVHKPTP
ncbi:MAG: sensor histidine kinase [Burkholderiales bacterium]